MKKLFFLLIGVLMGITVLRFALGTSTPMTLNRFLSTLSQVDLSFDDTLELIASWGKVMDNLKNTSSLGDIFVSVYTAAWHAFLVPLWILKDLLDFLASVLKFFAQLVY